MNARILWAASLELAKTVEATVSIEAEYGDNVIFGRQYTAAHHGPRADRPAPCIDKDIPQIDGGVILVSHIDLDTVGGCGRVLGHPAMDGHDAFWALAAHVDVNGPHRIADVKSSDRTKRELYAYWAWAQKHRLLRSTVEENEIHDMTGYVIEHLNTILEIFNEREDGPLLQEGNELYGREAVLNEKSWVQTIQDPNGVKIAVRVSGEFVNHLYVQPDGTVVDGVVALNPRTGAITISWADVRPGVTTSANACQIMQAVFGPTAGGHKGIAGSPRGIRMTLQDLNQVLEYLQA